MELDSGKESRRDQPTPYMETLPKDIYFDILSRLPISSLIQCKFVSKIWKSSAENPELANMHLSRPTANNLCLILHSDWPKFKLQLVNIGEPNSIISKELNISFQPMKPDYDVVGSSNGFLCLSLCVRDDPTYAVDSITRQHRKFLYKPRENPNAKIYIYNPFNEGYKKLPPTEFSGDRVFRLIFGFGFDSRTKDYKVIKIVYYRSDNYSSLVLDKKIKPDVYVFSFGKAAWRNIGKVDYFISGPSSEAMVNGKLHWRIYYSMNERSKTTLEILSFDLATEEILEMSHPNFGCRTRPSYHLVELKGCLAAVVFHHGETNDVWVMKNYGIMESWTKEIVIGTYVPRELGRVMRIRAKRALRVLCVMSNGDVLYLYRNRRLVSFNPNVGEFKEIIVPGMQFDFTATVLVGSLLSVDTVFQMDEKSGIGV